MAVNQKNSLKFLSISSSSENRDSIDTINGEAGDRDEEFYEEIEAPKFVDFTSPDHFRPDDRYWFCLRVGCNQKHEEEMDSEAIYKNFVLRVMAARSPNVRLKKALDRNASRTPIKCPLSAPPKSSKPRLSRLAILSSITDKKKRVIRPVLKPESTPVTKTKPVASKYLTTPRNKKCLPNQNSFRSVQNPKPTNTDVPKSRMVAKALVFHSPKKAIKVKTSIELRTPITKLCEGMKKLEISSQRKRALVSSSKSSKNLNTRASSRPEVVPLYSQSCTKNEAKCVRFCNSTMRGKLSKHVSKTLLGNDGLYNSKTNGDQDSKQGLVAKNITDDPDLQESREKEACSKSSAVPQPMNNLELASPDDSSWEEGKYLDIKESNNARTQSTTNTEEDNGSDVRNRLITSESCGHSEEQINENNPSEEERNVQEFMDDKENATTSHVNRMHDTNQKQNRRKIFGVHDKCGEAKKVAEAVDKHLKEGLISSGPVLKFKKPKPTNPKPFRLRTEERGILKEANLEKRTNSLAQSEPANLSTTTRGEKLQGKQTNDVQQKGKNMIVKTPKRQERSNVEAASVTPRSHRSLAHQQQQQQKPMNSPLKSSSIQRLEKMRKIRSPVQKQSVQPQGLVVSTKEEMISYLVPGKKLDVIHEAAAATSPEVLEQRLQEARKQTGYGAAASRSSSSGKRPVTVAVEPNFQTTHHVLPRSSCTKKLLK